MKKGVDCLGVSVVFFCHNGHGEVVMGKRSLNARDEQGRWDIGGGAVELHDTVEQTLKTEIKEEYNCDVISYEFLGYRDVHRVNNVESTHWITLDFKVLVDASKMRIMEPHKFDDLRLFPKGEYPENVHSQFPNFLKLYADKL